MEGRGQAENVNEPVKGDALIFKRLVNKFIVFLNFSNLIYSGIRIYGIMCKLFILQQILNG